MKDPRFSVAIFVSLRTGCTFYLVLLLTILAGCVSDNKEDRKDEVAALSDTSPTVDPPQENSIHVPAGFEVELLYQVPKNSQGTWVSLTIDEAGGMIASDQYDRGMYHIDIREKDEGKVAAHVRRMIMPLSGAQGLTWYRGSLYANVNGKGIFRLSDDGSKGFLNEMKFLGGPQDPSEHGNHALVPSPDGKSIYVVNGNHTPLPSDFTSRVLNWEEDILLTRQWDANGHAAGIMAPGGYIARVNGDADRWDILSVGYRNQYDIAIHPNGEIFTFDSDMEWDMGMPWYRPTRILHVVSGSDYGWRSGSGKWKEFYEDSCPSVLDIGPASPTGVIFGTGSRFPVRYQTALFALDWTYGTIYAIHLEPNGAGYKATSEEFLTGKPLPVVDAVIGKDGALYFITGGWGNESGLYRVTYSGSESVEPFIYPEKDAGSEARKLRHRLESFHGRQDPTAVATAWPYLADEDRFLRNAARVAIEFQPVRSWLGKAKAETRSQAVITSVVALARAGDSLHLSDALDLLDHLDFGSLDRGQKLGYLRALALTFMRLGEPDILQKQAISRRLLTFLEDEDDRVNVEVVRLLIRLKEEGVIAPALELIRHSEKPSPPDWSALIRRNDNYGGTVRQMLENPPPANKLEYLFMLRNMKNGWTEDQLRQYFSQIAEAADAMGGESYWGFLERMREEALLGLPDSVRTALADIISVPIAKAPPFEIHAPQGPGKKWNVDQAVKVVETPTEKRDFEMGRNAFFATGCVSCHRFGGWGGNIGPDLGSVGNRFSAQKILEDIIHPSANISDLYGSSRVLLSSGRVLEGLVVRDEGFLRVYSRNPSQAPEIISDSAVESIEPVPVSQMPEGLINTLNADELRSLIAYLQSGGNRDHPIFQ